MVDEITIYCTGCGDYLGYIDQRDQAKGECHLQPCKNCLGKAERDGFNTGFERGLWEGKQYQATSAY